MISIKKLENAFGIKELNGADSLGRINVIYAPNGTAKTSIANAIDNISKGISVKGAYPGDLEPSYEIVVDGKLCNETDSQPFSVINYSGVDGFPMLNDDESLDTLVISPALEKSVKPIIAAIHETEKQIANVLLSTFPKKGQSKKGDLLSNKLAEAVAIIAETQDKNDKDLIVKFIDNISLEAAPLPLTALSEDDFFSLASAALYKAFLPEPVHKSFSKYVEVVNKKMDDKVLDGDFSINSLNAFFASAKDNQYFDKNGTKRLLKISGKDYQESEMEKLVKDENDLVYGSGEVRQELDEVKKALPSNAATKTFMEKAAKDPWILKAAADYHNFVNDLFVTIIGLAKQLDLLKAEKDTLNKKREELKSYQSSYSADDSQIHKIWQLFKARCPSLKFDLQIENQFDAATGFQAPHFVKCIPGGSNSIDSPESLRFSTGEKRNFYFLNAIIEIEKKRLEKQPFVLILDDAVDSFDYKNKYGMIDYLVDIANDQKVQLIILTHNFDFFRSSILALGKQNVNKYFAYRGDSGVIQFYDIAEESYYLTLGDFNNWKANPSKEQLFALVPFARDVIQLESNSKDSDTLELDKYLHFDANKTDSLTMGSLLNVLSTRLCANVGQLFCANDPYLKTLANVIDNIVKPIKETNLEYKITIGIGVRVFLERFLSLTIHDKTQNWFVPTNQYIREKELLLQADQYLSEDDKSMVTESMIISPSYVHANSFMYEPLIDVGAGKLLEIYQKLFDKNNKWPLK